LFLYVILKISQYFMVTFIILFYEIVANFVEKQCSYFSYKFIEPYTALSQLSDRILTKIFSRLFHLLNIFTQKIRKFIGSC